MITLEAFIRKNTKIEMKNTEFMVSIADEEKISFSTMREAQDIVEEYAERTLEGDHKYNCEFCNLYCNEEDVQHRIEDQRFTAPLGSTFVLGGDIDSIPVCPICEDDLGECK